MFVVTQVCPTLPLGRRRPVPVIHPWQGDMGYDKTLERVTAQFDWPGIWGDVGRWFASCPEFQLVNQPALHPLPVRHGPHWIISPESTGYHFVFALVDYATRYPKAVLLRSISTESVGQALFQVISNLASRKRYRLTGAPRSCLAHQTNCTNPTFTTHRLTGW